MAALKPTIARATQRLAEWIWGPCPTCSANPFRGPAFLRPPVTSLLRWSLGQPAPGSAWLVPIYNQRPSISTTFSASSSLQQTQSPSLFLQYLASTQTPHLLVQTSFHLAIQAQAPSSSPAIKPTAICLTPRQVAESLYPAPAPFHMPPLLLLPKHESKTMLLATGPLQLCY